MWIVGSHFIYNQEKQTKNGSLRDPRGTVGYSGFYVSEKL